MQIADQAASENTLSTTTSMMVYPEKFSVFMKQNPIWNFYEISKNDYMGLPEEEKMKLIDDYYRHMSDGKSKFTFRSCLIHFRMIVLSPNKFFFFYSVKSVCLLQTESVVYE